MQDRNNKNDATNFFVALIVCLMFGFIGWKMHEVFVPPDDVCQSVDCKMIREQNTKLLNLWTAIKKLEAKRSK